MNEEELKKGCGKESGSFLFPKCGQYDDIGKLILCPTCQARLDGFQKGKLEALNKIDKVFSQYRGEVAKMIKEELIREIGEEKE